MSWQEELRKLDDDLAAGRISADDYRVRRDQVLSSAVTPGGAQAPASSQVEATQMIPKIPAADPQQQPPAPNTGSQAAANPDRTQVVDSDADKTQIVPGRTAEDAERTQTVGGWQTARPPGDAERTQIVPGVPLQSLAGGKPPRPAPPGPAVGSPPVGFPQPGWGQQEELSPPWAGSEFPPLVAGSPDWIKQGPEVFENGGGKGNTGKIVAVVLAVVLLGGIAFGAYWIWGRDSGTAGGGSTTTAAPPSTTVPPPPPDPLPVGTIPGAATENKKVSTFADMPGQRYLTDPELKAYRAGEAGETKLVISDLGDGNRIVVMLVEMGDAKSATTAAKAINQIQITNGMTKGTGSPAGVLVAQRAPEGTAKARLRAHYVHENILVRIDLTAADLTDGQTTFNDALAAQLEVLPADG